LEWPAVRKLEGDDPLFSSVRIVHVGVTLAVNGHADLTSDRHDLVSVPVVRLDLGFCRSVEEERPTMRFGELAPGTRADLSLITFNIPARQTLAAKLNATLLRVACKLCFANETEIAEQQGAAEPFVVLKTACATDDLTIFHLPMIEITFPAGEVFAIEER